MKSLNEYPTPETDMRLNKNAVSSQTAREDYELLIDLCDSLERRLAACREALESLLNMPDDRSFEDFSREDLEVYATASETLAATAKP